MSDATPAALCDPGMMPAPRLPKADERVNYRATGEDDEARCYGCRFYQWGSCSLVEGGIEAEYVCDLFSAPLKTAPPAVFAVRRESASPGHLTVVHPVNAFADPPEWAPFLPIPGRYEHPLYGTLDFSPERYARIVDNFTAGVYQERLPVNAEHDVMSSGAVGWIVGMRLADNGAIDAKVEWNERGKDLIKDDRYKYVSAEWFDVWTDPVSGEAIPDVAVGLALTTHPYFKESVLRPLAASEAVLTRVAAGIAPAAVSATTEERMGNQPPNDAANPIESPPVTPETPVTADDTTVQQLTEKILAELGKDTKITDPHVKAFAERAAINLAEAQAEAKRAKDETRRLAEQNAVLTATNRVKVFTDEVLGSPGTSGIAYVGHIPDMVRMLCSLADKYGDTSWEIEHYKTLNRAHAEQIKAGTLFKEIGIGRSGDATQTAEDQANAVARELAAKTPGMSHAQAFTQVIESDRELRAALEAERRGRRG